MRTAMRGGVSPVQQVEFPLRPLVVTLMLGRDLFSELMTDAEIDEQNGHEGCYRSNLHISGELGKWDVQMHEVTVGLDSGRENDGEFVVWLFVRGAEAMILDVEHPQYCDDETDGTICGASAVMTLQAARAALRQRADAYQLRVTEHLGELEGRFDELFKQLEGEVAV